MTREEIKYRMKRLARKFCKRNKVYEEFDSSVGKLIEKAYISAYLLCLHESQSNEDLATVAYMQGAERYKPKWHKVADGDLPKHEVNVLVLFNKQCVDIAHYNYDYKEWHFADSIVRDVIAWCEIPRYAEGGIK